MIPPTSSDSPHTNTLESRFHASWNQWQRKIPLLKRLREIFLRLPPRWRYAIVILYFGWKIIVGLTFLFVLTVTNLKYPQTNGLVQPQQQLQQQQQQQQPLTNRTKVLYIVTTLSEFNTGSRRTIKGQDRLGEVLLPIMVDSTESMISPPFNYEVDVFLISAYTLKPEREQLIRDSLPSGVGFQFWDDAAPLGYDKRKSKEVTVNTRALARQHRYVIKDKFFHYDLFVAFEDDMRITGHHVDHFLKMSHEIDQLREQAPLTLPDVPENFDDYTKSKFFGQMTKGQLARVIPGFIRVEVLLNDTDHSGQTKVLPIPIDHEFEAVGTRHIDQTICCHVNMKPNIRTPPKPAVEDVIIWETNTKAFTLRQLPPESKYLDWAVVMLGPGKKISKSEMVSGYWSGRHGAFGDEQRPSGGPPDLIAQQGGWMATRDQIARMNSGLCMGSFLPPFDPPFYYGDGQESMNVEFWSGSYQFFTGVKSGCNMQRILSLHPDHFSKHLIYHVANNKQKQLSKERMVRADHLFGQLNSVKKMAELDKQNILKEVN